MNTCSIHVYIHIFVNSRDQVLLIHINLCIYTYIHINICQPTRAGTAQKFCCKRPYLLHILGYVCLGVLKFVFAMIR